MRASTVKKAPTTTPARPTESIFDALRESHERQRALCRQLLRSKPHTADRLSIFTALRIELAAHAAAEERHLYVPILMDDRGLSPARHALHEHHQMDELVEDLQVTDHSGASWMATAKQLSHKVHHHLREEEKKFFQSSGKILDDALKMRLAKRYRREHARMVRSLQKA
ncbi:MULTISPECIES: hemerythrin domain-containing protein [Hydrocarboniphaga]|uniref:Hemerythrin n=1 Tax=Hydrocarboniphaga effusa AP103 TaxID=1172194 RepID=I8HWH5_9GAMM|nr:MULTISPECIES: hemerythrin domain-containing protein [Hydrocarboniphaga]EIT67686.1 hemerythrin [Hydrocarboniphaga effusa AP103]MDZ4080937.1 hemerythrin domain-containing protein [Hydrocarboniphaga sp.]